jgi:hypothetical protein
LYDAPPVPPLTLTVPGSLCVEPGDVAALPGELVAEPADVVVPHPKPWRLSEYAGAAPMAAMAIMQLADVTRIVSERKGPSSLVGLAMGRRPHGHQPRGGLNRGDHLTRSDFQMNSEEKSLPALRGIAVAPVPSRDRNFA